MVFQRKAAFSGVSTENEESNCPSRRSSRENSIINGIRIDNLRTLLLGLRKFALNKLLISRRRILFLHCWRLWRERSCEGFAI